MSFPHYHPTSGEGPNQTHTGTTAMPPNVSFNSDPTHIRHMADSSSNRRFSAHVRNPAPGGPASAVTDRFMIRHSPYISEAPSWHVPISASSTHETQASDGYDHRAGPTGGNLTFSPANTAARADSLGSGEYPIVISNSFPRTSSGSAIPTESSQPEHGHSTGISYDRSEASIYDTTGADDGGSGELRPRPRSRLSGSPAPHHPYAFYPGSGMAQESRSYASPPGSLAPTTGEFYFSHRSMRLNNTPGTSDVPFQWPAASTSVEAAESNHVTSMQWSNSPTSSHQLDSHP